FGCASARVTREVARTVCPWDIASTPPTSVLRHDTQRATAMVSERTSNRARHSDDRRSRFLAPHAGPLTGIEDLAIARLRYDVPSVGPGLVDSGPCAGVFSRRAQLARQPWCKIITVSPTTSCDLVTEIEVLPVRVRLRLPAHPTPDRIGELRNFPMAHSLLVGKGGRL